MKTANDCMYCTENEALKALMIPFYTLGHSKVYLFRNQSYRGRCVLAYKEHVNEFFDLSPEDTAAFAQDIRLVSLALHNAFSPKKVNLGMYNDKGTHLHCHIVPKYEGGPSFGSTFEMNPEPAALLSDAEYDELIRKITAALDELTTGK